MFEEESSALISEILFYLEETSPLNTPTPLKFPK